MMICRMLQGAMEAQLDRHGAIQSARLQQHLQSCPACRLWLQSHQQLERRLQIPQPCPVSPARISRLQAQLQQRLSESPAAAGQRTWRPAVRFAAAVLLLAAGLGLLYVYQSRTAQLPSGAADVLQLMTPSGGWQQIPRWAALSEQPIRTELGNLAADARGAMHFLVNCIPSGSLCAAQTDAAAPD